MSAVPVRGRQLPSVHGTTSTHRHSQNWSTIRKNSPLASQFIGMANLEAQPTPDDPGGPGLSELAEELPDFRRSPCVLVVAAIRVRGVATNEGAEFHGIARLAARQVGISVGAANILVQLD
jgi:hypothetical protein